MRGCKILLVLLVVVLAAPAHLPALEAPPAPRGKAVPDAFSSVKPAFDLLPVPKELHWGEGSFAIKSSTRIVVGNEAAEHDLYAVRELNEELRARYGMELRVVRSAEIANPSGHIVIGERGTNPLLEQLGLSVTPRLTRPEEYMLWVTRENIAIAGADRRGTFNGVQTLRQLLRASGSQPTSREVTIRDWPDHAIRAVHVLLDNASGEFHTALIDRILAPFKFNTLIAEAEYVQWESGRPLWSPDARGATKEQVKRLLDVAREHHIRVIPLVATLGHSEWVFAGLRDQAICEQVAYIPKRLRAQGQAQVTCDRSRGVFPAVYDPTRQIAVDGNSTTLNDALIFPVLKEAVELFRPEFLHLGHDEVRGPAGLRYDMDLYLQDTITLSRFVQSLGVRPMIWGDVLFERRREAEAEPLFKDVPRSITIVPWKYEDQREYPELAYFRQLGFPVIGATWYRLQNNHYMSRVANTVGALGMVRTTWTGHFQNRASLTRAYRQIYTYFSAANYFWNVERPAPDRAPAEAELARRFADAWMAAASPPGRIAGTLLDLSSIATQRHSDDDGTGWLGKGADYDLRALVPGRHRLGGILFEVLDPQKNEGKSIVMLRGEREVAAKLPRSAALRWRGRAGCIAFLHATLDRAVNFGETVGTYTITLAGGRRIPVNLVFGQNINNWLWDAERGIASIEQEVAWTGRTKAGVDVHLTTLRWMNPEPATAIQSIELASTGGRASPAVFAITALDRCP